MTPVQEYHRALAAYHDYYPALRQAHRDFMSRKTTLTELIRVVAHATDLFNQLDHAEQMLIYKDRRRGN